MSILLPKDLMNNLISLFTPTWRVQDHYAMGIVFPLSQAFAYSLEIQV